MFLNLCKYNLFRLTNFSLEVSGTFIMFIFFLRFSETYKKNQQIWRKKSLLKILSKNKRSVLETWNEKNIYFCMFQYIDNFFGTITEFWREEYLQVGKTQIKEKWSTQSYFVQHSQTQNPLWLIWAHFFVHVLDTIYYLINVSIKHAIFSRHPPSRLHSRKYEPNCWMARFISVLNYRTPHPHHTSSLHQVQFLS